ncbi:MAG TPA: N-acetylmuramic acid 6-phosphate etherase [Oculatellaceae cyanobacterium]
MGFTKEFNKLVTEERNERTMDLDTLDTHELVERVQAEDFEVAKAVQQVVPDIAKAIDIITERLRGGGRMFYFGAGTSGRLGVLDAAECVPTFGIEKDVVQALIAGGRDAMFQSYEDAEDQNELGVKDATLAKVTEKDVVIGISSSGRTPYVIGALTYSKEQGAAVVSIVNNPDSTLSTFSDVTIAALVGPEALTGSTRMKSGTAQKMILNLLSTCTMVRLGKVYENLMIDLKPTNYKLRERAVSIISILGDAPRQLAEGALVASHDKCKTAILMMKRKLGRAQAEELITRCGGSLRKALVAETNQ